MRTRLFALGRSVPSTQQGPKQVGVRTTGAFDAKVPGPCPPTVRIRWRRKDLVQRICQGADIAWRDEATKPGVTGFENFSHASFPSHRHDWSTRRQRLYYHVSERLPARRQNENIGMVKIIVRILDKPGHIDPV